MSFPSRARPLVLLALAASFAATVSGCALTTKSDVVVTRYFTPERVRPRLTAATSGGDRTGGARSPGDLALGRVTSGSNLRERIAYRNSAQELGYYEDQRWTERPETYVRRALGRTLFEERGFERFASGSGAPELDVEVLAFDELRLAGGARAARVQLRIVLWEDQEVLVEETLTVDHRVSAREPRIEEFVAAMAMALDEAADRASARVARALAARRERPSHAR